MSHLTVKSFFYVYHENMHAWTYIAAMIFFIYTNLNVQTFMFSGDKPWNPSSCDERCSRCCDGLLRPASWREDASDVRQCPCPCKVWHQFKSFEGQSSFLERLHQALLSSHLRVDSPMACKSSKLQVYKSRINYFIKHLMFSGPN